MMRADMFSLLSIGQNSKFIDGLKTSDSLKTECVKYLNQSNLDPAAHNEIKTKTKGWNRILFDKCHYNYMTNVLVINQPEDLASKNEKECCDYVYAGYLPSGRHQFLIYSPRAHKVFFKELVVDLNYAEIYPQKGFAKKRKVQKTTVDVW